MCCCATVSLPLSLSDQSSLLPWPHKFVLSLLGTQSLENENLIMGSFISFLLLSFHQCFFFYHNRKPTLKFMQIFVWIVWIWSFLFEFSASLNLIQTTRISAKPNRRGRKFKMEGNRRLYSNRRLTRCRILSLNFDWARPLSTPNLQPLNIIIYTYFSSFVLEWIP